MKLLKIAGIICLLAFVVWDWNRSSSPDVDRPSLKQDDPAQTQQTQQPNTEPIELNAPQQNVTTSGEADQYGRLPGDEHYGHSHPPQNQQQNIQTNTQQNNLNGGPDKYGRNPGDEHYGHDHQ